MKLTRTALTVLTTLSIVSFGVAQGVKLPPADLKPGQPYRVLVVTETRTDATSANIGDYDAVVRKDAEASPGLKNLGATWQCLGSTPSITAIQHTQSQPATKGIPIYRPDGVRLANDYTHLWGTRRVSLLAQPNVTTMGRATNAGRVWIGTYPTGAKHAPLGNAGTHVLSGAPSYTTYSWSFGNNLTKTYELPVYGLSGVMRVPTKTVTHVDLNHNFNGMVHAGETNRPDAADGYRSISDRGLDLTGGLPKHPVLDRYRIVSSANVPDIVHLGNRNKVDSGRWAFDSAIPGANASRGVQPAWLKSVDQAAPQVTILATPVELYGSSTLSLAFQVSNGGGSFRVTVSTVSGKTKTVAVMGQDWFGGKLPGTRFDAAILDGKLRVEEARIDLSEFAGEEIQSIRFHDRTNWNCGVAILGARLDSWLVEAKQVVRRGTPANPTAFLQGSQAPMIGKIWNPRIDHSSFAKASISDFMMLSAFAADRWVVPGVQGTILVSGPVLATLIAPSVGKPFAMPLPSQRSFLGVKLYTQGGSVDRDLNIYLANAIDVVIGDYSR